MLTLHLKISKMVKIQIVKISDTSDMINWNLFMFLIYVTPYSGSFNCSLFIQNISDTVLLSQYKQKENDGVTQFIQDPVKNTQNFKNRHF